MRVRTLMAAMMLAACGGHATRHAAPEPLGEQALAGRCFRLLEVDGTPIRERGLFWSGVVRLDTVRSRRLGRMDWPHHTGFDMVTAALPSDSLTADTTAISSHWWFRAPDSLMLHRTSGFVSELIVVRYAKERWVGDREFRDDFPGRETSAPVQLLPEVCP